MTEEELGSVRGDGTILIQIINGTQAGTVKRGQFVPNMATQGMCGGFLCFVPSSLL